MLCTYEESDVIPLESDVIPLESGIIPLDYDVIPLESDVVPMESDVLPLESDVVPFRRSLSSAIRVRCYPTHLRVCRLRRDRNCRRDPAGAERRVREGSHAVGRRREPVFR